MARSPAPTAPGSIRIGLQSAGLDAPPRHGPAAWQRRPVRPRGRRHDRREGLETILSLRQVMPSMPAAAALSANHLAALELPAGFDGSTSRETTIPQDRRSDTGRPRACRRRRGADARAALDDFNEDLRRLGAEVLRNGLCAQLAPDDRPLRCDQHSFRRAPLRREARASNNMEANMFDDIFFTHTAERYRAAPLLEQRERYLVHLKATGARRSTLRKCANDQLSLVRLLDLKDGERVSRSQIEAAAALWSQPRGRRCDRTASPKTRSHFVIHGLRWLAFWAGLTNATTVAIRMAPRSRPSHDGCARSAVSPTRPCRLSRGRRPLLRVAGEGRAVDVGR